MMGSNVYDDEKPIHQQTIYKPYWLARYPVTNAQWRLAVEEGALQEPLYKNWYKDKAMVNCPIVDVDWYQSLAFARWAKCLLPSETLWEYGARGVESWVYPWGNDWEGGKRVVWSENSGNKPNIVTTKSKGASWVGAMHLSGNVWEWQLNQYADYPYLVVDRDANDTGVRTDVKRVLRGGSFQARTYTVRSAMRFWEFPKINGSDYSFRLSRPIDSLNLFSDD
jgi:iron(II)-dependent oxidoreductase